MMPSVEIFKNLLENYSDELISTLEKNNFLETRISPIGEMMTKYTAREYLKNIVFIKSSAARFIDLMSTSNIACKSFSSSELFESIFKHVTAISEEKSIAMINASGNEDCFNITQPILLVLNKFTEEIVTSLSPNGFITFHAFSIRDEYFYTFHVHGMLNINFNIMEGMGIETMFASSAKTSLSNIYLIFIWLFIKENNGKINVNQISSNYHLISINIPKSLTSDFFVTN